MADKLRVNINISTTMKAWFEKKSNETGISQSALMAMALNEYIDQKEAIVAMSNVSGLIAKFESLKPDIAGKLDINDKIQ